MSVNEEDMTAALSEYFGGQGTTPEALDYARDILERYKTRGEDSAESAALGQMRERNEAVRGALEMARKRIMDQRAPGRGEALLAISAGLGAPTRTGSIGETAGNVSRNLLPHAQARREFENQRDSSLSEMDIAMAGIGSDVTNAEFALEKIREEQEGRMAVEALKTIGKGVKGRTGSAGVREAKIEDLIGRVLPDGTVVDRPRAVDIIDKHRDLVVTDAGVIRGIDKVTGRGWEVPLGNPVQRRGSGESELFRVGGEFENDPVQQRINRAIDNDEYSIWNLTELSTGPGSAIRAALSVPSSWLGGPVAQATIGARQTVQLRSRDAARSLVQNPRMPVRLVEMALEDISLTPALFDDVEVARPRLVALDREMWEYYQDFVEDSRNPAISEDDRSDASHNARVLASFIRDLGVPEADRKRRGAGPRPDPTKPVSPTVRPPPPVAEMSGFGKEEWQWLTPEERAEIDPSYREEDEYDDLPQMWD